ncbi:V-type ATP synthase subunit D [Aminiphilus sp.]|jgi:V/A-type H+-transporting ATPase subunit D|uniref:V-type ATP synthase subunit D n=1 Tax=Aminiphilus sp. TaxID=1872488 RepID=UPI0026041DE2|nr:V-type ATP synthase subunit D [Aminiphilus sp.]
MVLSPTREQMLALRRRTETIRYGMGLLQKKRDALVLAIEQERRLFASLGKKFRDLCVRISMVYALVRMYEGQHMLSLLHPGQIPLVVVMERHSLMGCTFAQFRPAHSEDELHPSTMKYDPALASIHLDDLLSALSDADEILWRYINVRAKLVALERDLRNTMRKINNLEHAVLPTLRAEYKRIREILAERERQDRYTLKKMSRRNRFISHEHENGLL